MGKSAIPQGETLWNHSGSGELSLHTSVSGGCCSGPSWGSSWSHSHHIFQDISWYPDHPTGNGTPWNSGISSLAMSPLWSSSTSSKNALVFTSLRPSRSRGRSSQPGRSGNHRDVLILLETRNYDRCCCCWWWSLGWYVLVEYHWWHY